MSDRRFYWLKLERHFFKRHDVSVIKARTGADGVFIYLFLLAESIDHQGELRFSPTIPYDAQMISELVGINQETVSKTLEILQALDLVKVTDDGTYFLTNLSKMVGKETTKAEYMREHRSNKTEQNGTMFQNVPHCYPNEEQNGKMFTDKDKDKELDKDKESDKDKSTIKTRKRNLPPLPDFETFESIFEKTLGYNPSDLKNLYEYIKTQNILDWQTAMINWGTGGKSNE